MKRLNAVEIRIGALRLEICALKDEMNRMAENGMDVVGEPYLEMKVRVLAKKFELAEMRSERKLLEMQAHTGEAA